MNPTDLVPTSDVLSAPAGWFQFFLLLTFPLHLLAMNALVGGTLTALVARFLPGPAYRELGHRLARALPFLVAFTVNLGVAPLLFLNVLYGPFLYTAAVLMGFLWLSVVVLVILAYYGSYWYDFSFQRLGSLGTPLLVAVLALLMGVGFLYSNLSTLMLAPEAWPRWFDQPGGGLLNLADRTLLPRYLHVITSSMAVGGILVALYCRKALAGQPEVAEAGTRLGLRLFSWLTLLQVALGSWFLMSLPRPVMLRFMGGDPWATGLLAFGLLLTVGALITGFRGKVVAAFAHTPPMVYVMALMRDEVRTGFLARYFQRSQVPVVPEWSPLVLFLGTLVVGVAVIAWMLMQLRNLQEAPKGNS